MRFPLFQHCSRGAEQSDRSKSSRTVVPYRERRDLAIVRPHKSTRSGSGFVTQQSFPRNLLQTKPVWLSLFLYVFFPCSSKLFLPLNQSESINIESSTQPVTTKDNNKVSKCMLAAPGTSQRPATSLLHSCHHPGTEANHPSGQQTTQLTTWTWF